MFYPEKANKPMEINHLRFSRKRGGLVHHDIPTLPYVMTIMIHVYCDRNLYVNGFIILISQLAILLFLFTLF